MLLQGHARVVTGPVLVTKNPALEPGDIRLFKAVGSPELERMNVRDVIVFSRHANGARDWALLGGYPLEERSFIVLWRDDLTAAVRDTERQLPANGRLWSKR